MNRIIEALEVGQAWTRAQKWPLAGDLFDRAIKDANQVVDLGHHMAEVGALQARLSAAGAEAEMYKKANAALKKSNQFLSNENERAEEVVEAAKAVGNRHYKGGKNGFPCLTAWPLLQEAIRRYEEGK